MTNTSRHSIASRLGLLFITLATVLLNTNNLDEVGMGKVALLQFGLLLVTGLAGFVAASAVVYVRRTHSPRDFRWFAYGWCGVSAFTASSAGVALGAIPNDWLEYSAVLGLLQSIVIFHSQLLIASGKIKRNNNLQLIQVSLLLIAVIIEFIILDNNSVMGFAKALGEALIITTLVSFFMLRGSWRDKPTVEDGNSDRSDARKKLLIYGSQGSTGSILQLLTNRSNLSFLDHYSWSAGAGVYALVYYGAEAMWSVARALAPMVNSEVAMADSKEKALEITKGYLKLTLLFTIPLVIVACLIPESIYEWVFSIEGVSFPLRLLAPGIVAGAVSSIIAHHLSGIGMHKWNTYTSGLGLVVLLSVGYYLIEDYGVCGAAIAASCAYSAQALGLIIGLKKV